MPIRGKAEPRSPNAIRKVAEMHQCEPAVIDAILHVEANGHGFDSKGFTIVRPEAGKVAVCPLLTDAQRARARKLGFLTEPRVGRGQLANDVYWAFIDRMATEFGDEAAYWCASFGAPQIMGFNYRMCGFATIPQMVAAFADSEDAQIEAMGRFLKAAGLTPALRAKSWKQIARFYNGPAYRENNYDAKLAHFYAESSAGKNSSAATMHDEAVEYGDRGDKVKNVQQRLRDLGFHCDADGDFGPETKDQVMAFQRRSGLTVDGRVDVLTNKALFEAPPKEPNQKPLAAIIQDSRTVQAGAGVVVTGAIAAAIGIAQAAMPAPGQGPAAQPVTKTAMQAALLPAHELRVALDVGAHHALFLLGAAAMGFGSIAILRRVRAQRLRKVG